MTEEEEYTPETKQERKKPDFDGEMVELEIPGKARVLISSDKYDANQLTSLAIQTFDYFFPPDEPITKPKQPLGV